MNLLRPCMNHPVWLTCSQVLVALVGLALTLAAPFWVVWMLVWYRGGFA